MTTLFPKQHRDKSRRAKNTWLSFGLFVSPVVFSLFLSQPLLLRAQQPATTAAPDEIAKIPSGSYQQTCLLTDVRGNNLKAICQAVNGEWLTTELHNTDRCAGDISNENGKLTCNPNRPPYRYLGVLEDRLNTWLNPGTSWAPAQLANWQLRHDSWTFKDGAPESAVALAQTSDGFLWIGGDTGLYRFDGRQFELFHPPFGEDLLSTNIRSLYAPPSGGLWIGYKFGGASFLDKGRVKNYGGEFAANSGSITMMVQDKDGIVWATGGSSGLWRFEHSNWEHIGMEWNVPINGATDLALDRKGNLWVGGERMLLSLGRGSRRFQVIQAGQDNVRLDPLSVLRLVDREGSVWFLSRKGLDRYFYSPLVDIGVGERTGSALAADGGDKALVGGYSGGLYRVTPAEVKVIAKDFQWQIQFIYRAPDTTIWLGASNGLWHESLSHHRPNRDPGERKAQFDVREALWRFTDRDWKMIDLPKEAADEAGYLQAITEDRFGGMWVSLARRGLYRLADGVWTRNGGRKDLPKTAGVLREFTDSLGRVWLGYTQNQLAVLDGDHVEVFGPSDGLNLGNITAIFGRGPKIWIGGEYGLAQFDAGQFKTIKAANNEWLRGISGIVETANGDLWLNGLVAIFHIHQSELAEALREPSYRVKGDHFGRREGQPGFAEPVGPVPTAMEGADGRLWFAGADGVVWLDPVGLRHQVTPTPITIQSISADDKAYEPTLPLRLPARTSSVQISYRAVSLSDPEAIRFRYKLHEIDSDWHEVSTASPVSYRNLSPGAYHFSVNATDTNGTWSDEVATAEFTILPAYYQTRWFMTLCIVSAMMLLYMLYLLRARQVARQFEVRIEERVNERIRIARELHDTLLQSLHGLMFQFQAVRNLMPRRPDEAMRTLEVAISDTKKALAESRDAIQDLRSEPVAKGNLAEFLIAASLELAQTGNGDHHEPPKFELIEEGAPRILSRTIQTEVCRIAVEVLRNAYRHAQAHRIEVEVRHGDEMLRLRIRDDGKGIDSNVLKEGGSAGHWGIPGVRERAKRIGAQVDFWSEAGAGTEVQLEVPASIAYEKSRDGVVSRLLRKVRDRAERSEPD